MGSKHEQGRPAKGLHVHQIEVGGNDQIAYELAVLDDRHRADGDFGSTPDQIEEANSEVAGKAFIDDLQGRHPAPDDPFLPTDIVSTYPSPTNFAGGFLGLPRYPAK